MSVDVTVDTLIDRPLALVAAYAADPSNAPEWYVNIDSVEWQTPPPVNEGSRMAFVARFLGRRLEYTYEVVELVPGERLVMRTEQGPFPMETTYTWESSGGSTRMTLRNRGRPEGFFKVAAPLMSAAMKRTTTKDLQRLKSILETAEGPREPGWPPGSSTKANRRTDALEPLEGRSTLTEGFGPRFGPQEVEKQCEIPSGRYLTPSLR